MGDYGGVLAGVAGAFGGYNTALQSQYQMQEADKRDALKYERQLALEELKEANRATAQKASFEQQSKMQEAGFERQRGLQEAGFEQQAEMQETSQEFQEGLIGKKKTAEVEAAEAKLDMQMKYTQANFDKIAAENGWEKGSEEYQSYKNKMVHGIKSGMSGEKKAELDARYTEEWSDRAKEDKDFIKSMQAYYGGEGGQVSKVEAEKMWIADKYLGMASVLGESQTQDTRLQQNLDRAEELRKSGMSIDEIVSAMRRSGATEAARVLEKRLMQSEQGVLQRQKEPHMIPQGAQSTL